VKGEAEGREGAEAEVARGAAADAEEDGDDPGAGGGEGNEFAGAEGGGVPRVALVAGEVVSAAVKVPALSATAPAHPVRSR
jgi:hypothetical protein